MFRLYLLSVWWHKNKLTYVYDLGMLPERLTSAKQWQHRGACESGPPSSPAMSPAPNAGGRQLGRIFWDSAGSFGRLTSVSAPLALHRAAPGALRFAGGL